MWISRLFIVDNYVDKLKVMHKLWINIVDKMWITFLVVLKNYYFSNYIPCYCNLLSRFSEKYKDCEVWKGIRSYTFYYKFTPKNALILYY